MPKVAFETLGCKLNQHETDALAADFLALGWTLAAENEAADAHVINTCTVTNKADRKSRSALGRHLAQGGQPIVVVTGCFAESARESLEGQEGVTFVVPNAKKNQIPALVDGALRGEVEAPRLPPPDPFASAALHRVFHTRATLKIQDGCDNFCTFCIIPSVRGRALSRPENEVLQAARDLVAAGRKELVLTGVNLGRWQGEGGRRFSDLARALLDLEGDFRLRITSLEPDGLGPAFADLFLHPKMAPHLHLCLQSASPRILLAMRREYRVEDYRTVVGLLRQRRPDLNLTTDLIVGFPGETEDDWGLSLEAVDTWGFGHVHVFPYSRRRDTRAERMPDQVAEAEKARRSRETQARALEARRRALGALVGQRRRVLTETLDEGRGPEVRLKGLSEDYFPVRWPGKARWNTWAEVEITGVGEAGGDPWLEAREL